MTTIILAARAITNERGARVAEVVVLDGPRAHRFTVGSVFMVGLQNGAWALLRLVSPGHFPVAVVVRRQTGVSVDVLVGMEAKIVR